MSSYDTPEFRAWAEDRKSRVLTMLDNSAMSLAILSPPFTLERLDVSQALEIGASLLLGKPLILCVTAGTVCPPGLVAAATAIVEMDEPVDSPSNQRRLQQVLADVLPRGDGSD